MDMGLKEIDDLVNDQPDTPNRNEEKTPPDSPEQNEDDSNSDIVGDTLAASSAIPTPSVDFGKSDRAKLAAEQSKNKAN